MVGVKRKLTLFMVMTLILSLFIVGCSNTTSENKGKDDNGDNGQGSSETVEITWWTFPNFQALDGELGKYEKQIIEAFNKKHPEIKVNLEMISFEGGPEKLNLAIASNTSPDMIYDAPGRIIDWAKKDLLMPLNDMFPKEVMDDISPALMKQSMVGDDVYMYPFNTGPFMMAVNKTIFEEIGELDLLPLDRPDRTWTVDEYEKALLAVKEKAPDVIPSGFYAKSVAGDQGTRGYITNLGGSRFLNEDYSEVAINSPGGVKGLEWVVEASKKGLVAPGSASLAASDHNDLFLQGKMAFAINYSAVLKSLFAPDKTVEFEDILLPYPTPDGSDPKLEPFLGGMAVFNNDDDKKAEAAKKLIDFIVNDPEWGKKNLIQTGGLSARNSITGVYEGSEYEYSELARKFITDPPTIADGYAEIRTFWFPALQEAILGTKTAQEALDNFAEKANEAIKKGKEK
ncbi:ABC transporter substrate-binding protein [Fredinandcohnia quinoae]|uniref:Sugar ABC transporter substrate-binding protein n=1 Tax=Fredinandcohnia quinoae TaxID=2918902 RepID=A0AAW5E4M1_9BACI|nr:sugar ABC transporter substrate-binding protein [Fredinandcohnia sp. SECRCQ15]MCH1624063.1 sugar ABC transporter substrate-binding protein [Fredinandcohnia sp. SECRCQ15]